MKIYFILAFGALGLGAAYTLQAISVVVVFKTARVFNFATGGIATVSAYVAGSISPGDNFGKRVLGLIVGVAVGAFIGLLMEATLRFSRSPLNRTVVTLGWLLFLQGVIAYLFGANTTHADDPIASAEPLIHIDHSLFDMTHAQALTIILALAVAGGLTVFFRGTKVGIATRAVADDPQAARLLGLRVGRIDQVAWLIGGSVAGLTGVLLSMLDGGFDQIGLIAFSIEALAAVLVAGLISIPLALLGGFALAIIQAEVSYKFSNVTGTDELVALIIILIALAFRRQSGRGDQGGGGLIPIAVPALPRGVTAVAMAAGALAVIVALPLIAGKTNTINVAQFAAWSIAILSLVLLTGVVGQISLCQGSFMGIGAYSAAIAAGHHIPFLIAIPIGGLVAGGAAMIVGIPALRLTPLEMAIMTLSLAFAADYFLFEWTPLASSTGPRPLPDPGFAVPTHHSGQEHYAWLCLAVFVAIALAVAALRRGRTGAALTALRSSPAATSAMGFSVTWAKLRGFAISGGIAGIAGGLYAGLTQSASGTPFNTVQSISLLAFAVIAGVGNIPGAVVGGAIVTLTTISYSTGSNGIVNPHTAAISTILTGAVLIAVVLLAPTGITGLVSRAVEAIRNRREPPALPPRVAVSDREAVSV